MTLPPEIVDLESIAPHPNILIFSKQGTGKTVFAGSDDSVLILNCESEGTLSAKRQGSRAKQWNIKTWKDFEKATDWIKDQFRLGKKFPFKWVAVDTLTTLQNRILMRHILDEVVKAKSYRDPDIPDKPEYLKNQLMLQRNIKELNDLPVNMLYTAHVMQQTDSDGEEFLFPAIQGKKYEVAQAVLAMMTSYGYMYSKVRTVDGKPQTDPVTKRFVKDRYIVWEDYKEMQGKDRTNALGSVTKNLTLKELRERIEAADKKQETATETKN